MSYARVESDEQPAEGLQFKSFLGTTESQAQNGNGRSSGYLADQPQRPRSSGGFWTVEYYQPYFDVDTNMVLKRCYSTLIPQAPTKASYISTHLHPIPDLYGPFWTLTTLIFTLFLSSSLAASVSAYLSSPSSDGSAPSDALVAMEYDFGLLSIAVAIVYSYGLGLPVLLWLALRYLGVGEWSVVEALALWGYALFVWIPVSLICVIPVAMLRWALVGTAFGLSGYFLLTNVYPILATAEAKSTRLLTIVILALHAGLALAFKVLFFSYYVVGDIGPADPISDPVPTPEVGNLTALFLS